MDATLKVISGDITTHDLQDLTQDLCNTMNNETELKAAIPEKQGNVGEKGGAIELGQILITALTSGTIVSLFNVLKSYFEREPSLEFEFTRSDGTTLKIHEKQLGKTQIDNTMKIINDFFKGQR
jgi:hypothetical protein